MSEPAASAATTTVKANSDQEFSTELLRVYYGMHYNLKTAFHDC